MRRRLLPISGTQDSGGGTALPTMSPTLEGQNLPSPYGLRRFVSGLEEVPEEESDRANEQRRRETPTKTPPVVAQATAGFAGSSTKTTPALRGKSSKSRLFHRYMLGNTASPSNAVGTSIVADSPASIETPMTKLSSREGLAYEGGSGPPTPSRKSKVKSPGLLSEFGQLVKTKGRKVKAVLQKPRKIYVDPSLYSHLYTYNGCFTRKTIFHAPKVLQQDLALPNVSQMKPIRFTERKTIEELKLIRPVRIQYKVYLFERILLCCKEINPNKPKNKMMGNNKALIDKKGKPRLQLKGRIFMQNVTDVLTVAKSGEDSPRLVLGRAC